MSRAVLKRLFVALMAICVLGGAGLAVAQNRSIELVTSEFPPFEYTGPDGQPSGVDVDIVRAVLMRMGYEPNIRIVPWKRAQIMAEEGEAAGIFSLTKSPEREVRYVFSDPINTVRDVFFKQRDRAIAWKQLSDLKAMHIGYSQGYAYAPEFLQAIDGKGFRSSTPIVSQTPELQGLNMLARNRFDLFLCEVNVCRHLVESEPTRFAALDFVDKSVGEVRTYHIGFSKASAGAAQLAAAFNIELAKFVAEGKRAELFRKYGMKTSLK